MDRPSTLANIYRWPTRRSKEWTKALLSEAERDDNVVAIVAIGSAVRPSVRSADVDLLVICADCQKFKPQPPIEVDVRLYQAGEVLDLIEKRDDLLIWALMFGKVLFQRADYWDRLITSQKGAIPLPLQDTAVKRAEQAKARLLDMIDLGDESAASDLALSYLTHLGRALILKENEHPRSRPELPDQLRDLKYDRVADCLELILKKRRLKLRELESLLRVVPSEFAFS